MNILPIICIKVQPYCCDFHGEKNCSILIVSEIITSVGNLILHFNGERDDTMIISQVVITPLSD